MKAFLEEYGFSILLAIVVILLIMMISPVGTSVKESLGGIVTSFTGTANEGLDSASNVLANSLDTLVSESQNSESTNVCYSGICLYDLLAAENGVRTHYLWITNINEEEVTARIVFNKDEHFQVSDFANSGSLNDLVSASGDISLIQHNWHPETVSEPDGVSVGTHISFNGTTYAISQIDDSCGTFNFQSLLAYNKNPLLETVYAFSSCPLSGLKLDHLVWNDNIGKYVYKIKPGDRIRYGEIDTETGAYKYIQAKKVKEVEYLNEHGFISNIKFEDDTTVNCVMVIEDEIHTFYRYLESTTK